MDAGNQKTLTDKGSGDAYVVKIAKSGVTSWATSAGSSGATERAMSIAETSSGDIIVGGLDLNVLQISEFIPHLAMVV